uniref:Uncharacterized protein n=1 Tax=Utricularia reniformis TaxID=192314 RepID=A0A1Y0B1B6_9LAMI|nr:hypothetical protein AEK19_MT1024 [Utricularia reniformis]ART31246.1 hypothetical protein AEK19_MT1024 [Utricularia reniformis]
MDHARFFLEKTLLGCSLAQWLTYLHWYVKIIQSIHLGENPYMILDNLLNPPLVHMDYVPTNAEPDLVRFGKVWSLWYLVREKGFEWSPGILSSKTLNNKSIMYMEGINVYARQS